MPNGHRVPSRVVRVLLLGVMVITAIVVVGLAAMSGQGPLASGWPASTAATTYGVATQRPDTGSNPTEPITTVPWATAARPTGIFNAGTEFFHEGYRMQNAWQGLADGNWANVVAGAHSDDPQQGLVFSSWEFPNAAIGSFFNTPLRAGSVHIIVEQNYRITLQAEDGTLFYWDIPSQSFIDSVTAVAPTITPPPTHTPTATVLPPPTQSGPGGYPASAVN